MTEFDLTSDDKPVRKHSPARLAALKSGKTVWDGEILAVLQRIADAAELLVKYYDQVFESTTPAKSRKSDA